MAEATIRKSLEPYIKDSVQYYPHQIEGIRTLYRKSSFLLADDMGLGKSLQAMTIFAMHVKTHGVTKCIIVCPPSLKGNWQDEIEKFSGMECLVVPTLTPKKREALILKFRDEMTGPRFLIVNYEQVVSHLVLLNTVGFDVAIFDEAHYIKNYKSSRTKASLGLRVPHSFMLTGTPMLNRVNELWPLLNRINPKAFPSYWKFTHRYCVFGGYNNKEITGIKNEGELKRILKEYMLRRMKDEVLDLPPLQIIERRVDLLPEQRKLYDQAVKDLKVEMMGESKDVDNPLVKATRLKQICGTTMEFTGEDHSAKLDVALDDDTQLIESGHKVVVFTQFRSVHTAYAERLRKAGIGTYELTGSTPMDKRQEIVKLWSSDPEPTILLCMLQVSGVGLNMTAANHCSFLDKLFVPGLNQQAVDRLRRIGATGESIQVREYICRGTYENRIAAINRFKTELTSQIIGADAEPDDDFRKKIIEALEEEVG